MCILIQVLHLVKVTVTGYLFNCKHSSYTKLRLTKLIVDSEITWRSSTIGNVLFDTVNNSSTLACRKTAEYILSLAVRDGIVHQLACNVDEKLSNYLLALPPVTVLGLRLSPVLKLEVLYRHILNEDDSVTDQIQFHTCELSYNYHQLNDARSLLQAVPPDTVVMKDASTTESTTSWPNDSNKPTSLNIITNVELAIQLRHSENTLPASFVESSGNVILQNYINMLSSSLLRKLPLYLMR